MKVKTFFVTTDNVVRSSYAWNMVGGAIMALQSVIMLMILTRTTSLAIAGMFTIAYANANFFLTIGKYGSMRRFQASDTAFQFSSDDYYRARFVTVLSMLVIAAVYTVYVGIHNQHSLYKSWVLFLVCVLKAADAVEDMFTGEYQRKNRLDVGAKITTVRIVMTILIFFLCMMITRDLLTSVIVATIATYGLMFTFVRWVNETGEDFLREEKSERRKGAVRELLRLCFPVFASYFLSYYISNAPKFAIDAVLNDELQACYGFISMPVLVITVLNDFIFVPIIYQLTQLWLNNELHKFVRRVFSQMGIVAGLSLGCLAGAYLLGIPVLSFIYQTDLSMYKTEFLILMVGGGFLGFSGLLLTTITIIRRQTLMLFAYGVVGLAALICANYVVRRYALLGAAVLYAVLMMALCIGLGAIFVFSVLRKKSELRP